MSILGIALRDNADLHRAIYRIVGDLAAAHLSAVDPLTGAQCIGISRPQLDYLCDLAAAVLPHLPAPERSGPGAG